MFVYLDNSSTTRPYPEVVDTMAEAMKNRYGNPSSLHKMGVEAEMEIKTAKKTILKSLNNPDGEIFFTSGGTESNNLAILGAARRLSKRKNHIITSKTEHKSVIEACNKLGEEGYRVTFLDVDREGRVGIQDIIDAITPETALISMMMVNNETGIVQPIEDLAKALKKMTNPPLLHVDGVQAYGKIRIDMKRLGVDLFTASGHKIHGPKGIGFLYIKKGVHIAPILFGGGQQLDIRPGTENTFGIIGLEKAIQITFNEFEQKMAELKFKRNLLREKISEALPEVIFNTPESLETAPHILHASFPNIRGEVLLHALETDGIYVAIGSACNSKVKKFSHVLEAMKLSNNHKEGAVRFSLSVESTLEEIEYAADKIIENYKSLHEIIRGR